MSRYNLNSSLLVIIPSTVLLAQCCHEDTWTHLSSDKQNLFPAAELLDQRPWVSNISMGGTTLLYMAVLAIRSSTRHTWVVLSPHPGPHHIGKCFDVGQHGRCWCFIVVWICIPHRRSDMETVNQLFHRHSYFISGRFRLLSFPGDWQTVFANKRIHHFLSHELQAFSAGSFYLDLKSQVS